MREKNMASIKPYGVAIQEARLSGDLVKMKAISEQSEYIINNVEEIRTELKKLKEQIRIKEG